MLIPVVAPVVGAVRKAGRTTRDMLMVLEKRERIVLVGGLGCLLTMLSMFAVFHKQVLHWMISFSDNYRHLKFGWLIILLLLFAVSFPPLIGYSALSAFTGMVYGFPGGWPLLAAGTLFGSFLSFLTFRYLLHDRAEQLARANVKFMAFAKTLEFDKFVLLWLIRLCPLPYSLSNAAMSSVPTVQPWRFFLATACVTPKLFLHIFIGDRLRRLAGAQDTSTMVANLISIILALVVAVITTYLIWQRTTERALAIEAGREALYQGPMEDDGLDNFEISEDEVDRESDFGV